MKLQYSSNTKSVKAGYKDTSSGLKWPTFLKNIYFSTIQIDLSQRLKFLSKMSIVAGLIRVG
jgi:hypothetical protein